MKIKGPVLCSGSVMLGSSYVMLYLDGLIQRIEMIAISQLQLEGKRVMCSFHSLMLRKKRSLTSRCVFVKQVKNVAIGA